jgi:hypothetical protein
MNSLTPSAVASNPSIERTFQRPLRALWNALMSNVRHQQVKSPNSTPFAFLRLASEYLTAADSVLQPTSSPAEELRQRLSLPAFFLVGHAIELALKAFLLARGSTVSQLRSRAYGHSLIALLAEARRRKLGKLVKLSRDELAAIHVLNQMYAAKEFEYVVNGVRGLPHYFVAHSTASRLCRGLRDHCVRLASYPSIERTSSSRLRLLPVAAHVER